MHSGSMEVDVDEMLDIYYIQRMLDKLMKIWCHSNEFVTWFLSNDVEQFEVITKLEHISLDFVDEWEWTDILEK